MIAAALPDGWTRLVLVRHGATRSPGRLIGRLDPELSDEGLAQARRVAALLDGVRLDAVYASPLARALGTARPLAETRGLQPIVRDGLAELDFGALEGLTPDEACARHPAVWARYLAAPAEVAFPDGESWPRLAARVQAEAGALVEAHAGRAVAVVCHGGPVRAILAGALGLDGAHAFRLELQHGAVSIVDARGGEAVVRLVNRAP